MDLNNNQTQSPLENMMEGASVVDPSNFMDLMDDGAFHSSLDATVLDNTNTASSTSASSTSSVPSQNQKQQTRPEIVEWSPQDGQAGDTVTVVLKQSSQSILQSMKICFNSIMAETSEHHQEKENHIWITLVAKVPSLEDTHKQAVGDRLNQTPVAVCIYDPARHQTVDHWSIGTFTYLQGNKRAAEEVPLYNLDTSPYAKKSHPQTSDYIGQSSDFGQGDFMNLLSPYNDSHDSTGPTSAQPLLGKLPSPTIQGLPKAVSMPDMRKPSIEEPQTTPNAMLQGNIPPSPTNIRMHPPSTTMPHRQQQSGNANMPYSNAPQIMPRASPTSFSYSQPYYNTSNTGNSSYGESGSATYGNLAYPSYQDQNMAYLQQPNTASYDSTNYFPQQNTQQYNYGNPPSYFGHPTNVTAPPLTPPLQQKRLSQSHGTIPPPTTGPYPPPAKVSKRHPSIPSNVSDIQHASHPFAGLVSRPQLNIHNDLMEATQNWTPTEWAMRRRVLRFWRQQQQPNPQQIDCGFEILDEEAYRNERMHHHQQQHRDDGATSPNSSAAAMYNNYKDNLVVSCIYWQERNDYFITSVDCIQLIEGLIGVEFTVEEKNRIRRNLEALRPLTAAKTRPESVDFFKLIMGFPAPKPRNIEKDVKVFLWSTLGPAIKKIIGKYTPSYSSTASVVNYNDISSYPPPLFQQQHQQPPPPPSQQQQQRSAATPQLSRS